MRDELLVDVICDLHTAWDLLICECWETSADDLMRGASERVRDTEGGTGRFLTHFLTVCLKNCRHTPPRVIQPTLQTRITAETNTHQHSYCFNIREKTLTKPCVWNTTMKGLNVTLEHKTSHKSQFCEI